MGDKQDQRLSDGAFGIQAKRDVIVNNGLSVTEVRELVNLFLKNHLPALREEAAKAASENAQKFLDILVDRLSQTNSVTQEAFSKPDSQACFNAALTGSAEKGEQIDNHLLAEAVLRRLESDGEPLLKLISEQSVTALSKLNRRQIAFIAFVQYLGNMRHTNAQSVEELEFNAKRVLEIVKPGLNLSEPNQEYLASVGLITINRVASANRIKEVMKDYYPFLPAGDKELKGRAPCLHKLISAFGQAGAQMIFLTSVGKFIGLLALERALGKIDVSVWIH